MKALSAIIDVTVGLLRSPLVNRHIIDDIIEVRKLTACQQDAGDKARCRWVLARDLLSAVAKVVNALICHTLQTH